jgi:GxxExxY protein
LIAPFAYTRISGPVCSSLFTRRPSRENLERAGLRTERQVGVPIVYEGTTFAEGFRADLIVEAKVIVEVKSVEKVIPVHKKQLLTYLKLTGLKLGYLLNFGEELMKPGHYESHQWHPVIPRVLARLGEEL